MNDRKNLIANKSMRHIQDIDKAKFFSLISLLPSSPSIGTCSAKVLQNNLASHENSHFVFQIK
jgi:hypothetical protein